jgi:uncharacterized protein YegP (UPF0339 family)
MAKFEIYQDAQLEFHWRFRANNGKILAESGESYNNRANCEHAIISMRQQVPRAVVIDQVESSLRVATAQ